MSGSSKDKDGNEIIQEIKGGNQEIITRIYRENKSRYFGFIRKQFSFTMEDIDELYQISVVTFYENVINNKLVELTAEVGTYLNAIGRLKALELTRRNKRSIKFDDLPLFEFMEDDEGELENRMLLESRIDSISKNLAKLKDKCQKILKMFYYEGKSMSDIQELFNFSSASVAKNEKYKCMQKLKTLSNAG